MSGIGLGHVYSMENGHLPFYNETFFHLWKIRHQWIANAVIIDYQEKGKICGQQWLTTLSGCKIHCWLSSMWMQLFKTSSSTVPQICEVPWLFGVNANWGHPGHPGCQTFIVVSQMALKWVLELKSCTHTLHSSLVEQWLSCTDKNTPEIIFMRLKRMPPCLGECKQRDEQTLMTKPAWQVVWPLFSTRGFIGLHLHRGFVATGVVGGLWTLSAQITIPQPGPKIFQGLNSFYT